ncbi:LysR family transcriptional regulator [Vibrio mangrovi]|uniref:HTH-type transcriptional regulator DmlR n=1 Tax=Vibrio mangrovi TaxID=474394 RepID=A0A1Y6IRH1_9VIBR|nr:LysR family transcriptional regulator [Vibrio mangrovi]MDW6004110.1 LysR family transcriptional regulator [Vibrio mangrovi]SMR99092.1 HTH-type transcriptional regulator DmlR [Vibrio mangrovi]
MDDLNDLALFAAVVRHQGFTAAARATGIEKTRLSRRVAALEKRLGVLLLQRSTRSVTLTEAGSLFYERCQFIIEGAQSAYESILELKSEPTGTIRISCPVLLAQNYLAPILPGYMAAYPKVTVILDATDRHVNLIEERFDIALRAQYQIEDSNNYVARELGQARRIMVASPNYLNLSGRPEIPEALHTLQIISRLSDMQDRLAHWPLRRESEHQILQLEPRLATGDLRVQLEAAIHGIGVALMPEPIVSAALKSGLLEQVLPPWHASGHIIHMLYPKPKGMLPSVRSLIDYLQAQMPATIIERSVLTPQTGVS